MLVPINLYVHLYSGCTFVQAVSYFNVVAADLVNGLYALAQGTAMGFLKGSTIVHGDVGHMSADGPCSHTYIFGLNESKSGALSGGDHLGAVFLVDQGDNAAVLSVDGCFYKLIFQNDVGPFSADAVGFDLI